MVDLERRFDEAFTMASAVSSKLIDATLEHLEQIIETVTRLGGAANALAGTECFLRLQNGAVRQ